MHHPHSICTIPSDSSHSLHQSPAWLSTCCISHALGRKPTKTTLFLAFSSDDPSSQSAPLTSHQVVHNPGAVPDPRYLATADTTIIFEEAYSTFQERYQANLLADIPCNGTAALIHSVPDSVKGPELRDLVRTVRKVADEVFITHLAEHYYASFGAMWAEFVDLMAAYDPDS